MPQNVNPHQGSILDSFFRELGELQDVQGITLRKDNRGRFGRDHEAAEEDSCEPASGFRVSRPQVDRLLHPMPRNSISVAMLMRAATLTGKRLELVDA